MLIAVDHGNKQIKTVHTPPFTSGLIQSDTPGFGTDALAYSFADGFETKTGRQNCRPVRMLPGGQSIFVPP